MLNPLVSVHAKSLYVVLKLFADKSGKCFPSRQTLAEALGLSKATVSRHLAELESAGIVTRHLTAGKGTVYTIHDQEPVKPSDEKEKKLEAIEIERGDEMGEEQGDALLKNENTPFSKMRRGVVKNENTPFSKMRRGVVKNEKGIWNNTNQRNQLTAPTTEERGGDAVVVEETRVKESPNASAHQFPTPTTDDIMAYAAVAGLDPQMAIKAFQALVGRGWDQRRDWRAWVTKGAKLRMQNSATRPTELGAEFFDSTRLSHLRDTDQQIERKLEHWDTAEGIRYRHPSPRPAPDGWKILYKPKEIIA